MVHECRNFDWGNVWTVNIGRSVTRMHRHYVSMVHAPLTRAFHGSSTSKPLCNHYIYGGGGGTAPHLRFSSPSVVVPTSVYFSYCKILCQCCKIFPISPGSCPLRISRLPPALLLPPVDFSPPLLPESSLRFQRIKFTFSKNQVYVSKNQVLFLKNQVYVSKNQVLFLKNQGD